MCLPADGLAGLLGFVASSFTFKQYITRPSWKLLVFVCTAVGYGTFAYFFASHRSFAALVVCAMVMHFIANYGGGGESGMFVYTMGPVSMEGVLREYVSM